MQAALAQMRRRSADRVEPFVEPIVGCRAPADPASRYPPWRLSWLPGVWLTRSETVITTAALGSGVIPHHSHDTVPAQLVEQQMNIHSALIRMPGRGQLPNVVIGRLVGKPNQSRQVFCAPTSSPGKVCSLPSLAAAHIPRASPMPQMPDR